MHIFGYLGFIYDYYNLDLVDKVTGDVRVWLLWLPWAQYQAGG